MFLHYTPMRMHRIGLARGPRHPTLALCLCTRAPQAHLQPPEMHLHHQIEQAEHLHDFHDLWHDTTISSTPREQQLRYVAVFCTLNHGAPVVAHNGRVNDLVQARIRRVATTGSRLSSPGLHPKLLDLPTDIEHPVNELQMENLWSQNERKRPLRHDSDVNDQRRTAL